MLGMGNPNVAPNDNLPEKVLVSTEYLYDTADAIREVSGNSTKYTPAQFGDAIRGIDPSTPQRSWWSDVNFFDNNGRIVYSYTTNHFLEIGEMPDDQAASSLTHQGWNWSLSDALDYVEEYGKLNVGQMYITDTGETRLEISVANTGRTTVPLYFSQTVSGGVQIDWGDGSARKTVDGTGYVSTSHTYTNASDYVISLMPANNCELGLGHSELSISLFGGGSDLEAYKYMLRRVEIGENVSEIGAYAFDGCIGLRSITIPDSVTSIGVGAFANCSTLESITIPISVTSIGSSAFSNCYALSKISVNPAVTSIGNGAFGTCRLLSLITLPDSLTGIGSNTFFNCSSITDFIIPSGVTNVGAGAFQNCYGASMFVLNSSTPPVLANSNAFQGIPNDCVFSLPDGSLGTYQNASNWSELALYMQERA